MNAGPVKLTGRRWWPGVAAGERGPGRPSAANSVYCRGLERSVLREAVDLPRLGMHPCKVDVTMIFCNSAEQLPEVNGKFSSWE